MKSRAKLQRSTCIFASIILLTLSISQPISAKLDTSSISREDANTVILACISSAKSDNINISIAILDRNGTLVSFQRMDAANQPTVEFSKQKAMTSIVTRKPSKLAQDRISQGHTQILAFQGTLPVQGGLPIIDNGQLIGAVGVSGAPPILDEKCAQTGLDSLKQE